MKKVTIDYRQDKTQNTAGKSGTAPPYFVYGRYVVLNFIFRALHGG